MTLTDSATGNGSQRPAGGWLSTHEALVQLSISERTLFRRLAAGKLQRRTLEDGRVQVWLPLPADRQTTVTRPETLTVGDRQMADADRQPSWAENGHAGSALSDSDSQAEPERALALLDRFNVALARQLEPLIAEVRASRERNEELARENGQLAERVQELERRASLADSERQELEMLRAEHDLHVRRLDPPVAEVEPRRSWWRRLLG